MTWSTWRQHRLEALAGLAVLAGLAAMIFVANWRHDLAGGGNTTGLDQPIQLSLGVLPALVGVFIGAPLLARDLEQGTHRLLWTQGTTRARWLRWKLGLVGGVVTIGAALLAAYFTATLLGQHMTLPDGSVENLADSWVWFDEGPALAAYAVFALALGTAAGAVIRRTYPAMALTLAIYVAVRVPIASAARPNYLPPLRLQVSYYETFNLPGPQVWIQYPATYQDASGHTLSMSEVTDRLGAQGGALASHGIVGWVNYQPGDRFLAFQGIEAAIFLGLAALLVGLAYYWTTRRVT